MVLGEQYCPTDYPNLPNVLSKVTDERTALRFATKFGTLGFHGMAPSEEHAGEPLRWVLLQAQSVRLAGELLSALASEGPDAADNVLRRWSVGREELVLERSVEGDVTKGRVVIDRFVVAQGLATVTAVLPNALTPRYQAMELVETLVNTNTAGVRYRLRLHLEERFSEDIQPSALIEAIWWHVGQWAIDGRVRLCENPKCRAPFKVTDERQRFCPGDDSHVGGDGRYRAGRSICAALCQQSTKRAAEKCRREKGG